MIYISFSILSILFFILGLIIGSFLNVVIYRMNTARSFGGRSACMSCESKLSWYELIPIFSFLGLMGRCRNCKTRISIQYPLVELATGLVFVFLFLKFQNYFFLDPTMFVVAYSYYALMFSLLVVIAVYDFKHKIIPDILALIFGILALIGLFFFGDNGFGHMPSLFEFLSGVLLALPFFLFWLLSRGAWMGLGDAKLALGLGWLLPFPEALSGAVIAVWSGAIIGIYLIFSRKGYDMKSEIPFAPYLIFGAFVAFICELNLFGINF